MYSSWFIVIFMCYAGTFLYGNAETKFTSESNRKSNSGQVSQNEKTEPDSTQKPYLKRCCEKNEHFINRTCLPVNESLFRVPPIQGLQSESDRSSRFNISHEFPNCDNKLILPTKKYVLYENGALFVEEFGHFPYTNYCLEYFENRNGTWPIICSYSDEECAEKSSQDILHGCMLLSVFCSMITFFVYASVQNLRRQLKNQCLLCHVLSLICCYLNLLLVRTIPSWNFTSNSVCRLLPYTTLFSSISTFMWLNVMCLEMWFTVRNGSMFQGSQLKKFMQYCVYAWGIPSVVCLITFSVEQSWIPDYFMKPDFDQRTCWFRSDQDWSTPFYETSKFWYLYSIPAITLIVNLFAFLHAAILLFLKERKWTKNGAELKRHKKKHINGFALYLKLFLFMGILWIMEIIMSVIRTTCDKAKFWWIFDIINSSQGFIIFVLLCWDKKILLALNKRFCPKLSLVKDNKRNVSCRTVSGRLSSSGNSSTAGNRSRLGSCQSEITPSPPVSEDVGNR